MFKSGDSNLQENKRRKRSNKMNFSRPKFWKFPIGWLFISYFFFAEEILEMERKKNKFVSK